MTPAAPAIDHAPPGTPDAPASSRSRWVAFGVVAALLSIAAVGLNAAVGVMEVQFQKLPVPLRKPVAMIPADLGEWTQLSLDRPLGAEMEEALGTKEYVFRFYADRDAVPADRLKEFDGLPADAREQLGYALQRQYPGGVVRAAVTYYTGSVDTVPHIPERCMVGGGFDPVDPEVVTWPVFPDRAGDAKDLEVRLIQFEQAADVGPSTDVVPMDVAYFFQVNGGYESDPITGVRLRLQDLTVRHGYFAKVELMTQGRDRDLAATTMTRFLTAAMPAVEACLPDWKQYEPGA